MQMIEVSPRLTNDYQSGWSHLEEWGDAIRVKLLKWKPSKSDPNDSYEGYTKMTRAIAPQGVDDELVARALSDTLSGSSCRHEHDCCGCKLFHAQVKKIRHRTWLVKLSISYNV